MASYLGLDIGSNSVGSAWVNAETGEITVGASVFPAGVEDSKRGRGAPKNLARRMKRSQRRNIRRRSDRKKRLRQILMDSGLLPQDAAALDALFQTDPWTLRRDGLHRRLTPHEFGRVLVHLGQRRGALGIERDDESDTGKVKDAIDHTQKELTARDAPTVGVLMAALREERRHPTRDGKAFFDAIRNRGGAFEFHAERAMIRKEFNLLWSRQLEFGGELAALLTDKLKEKLDQPAGDRTWQCRGAIFEQRRTYWDTGTLGRCDLEPTDHRCPQTDRHAQAFLVLETLNNIRVQERGQCERPLTPEERAKVISLLRRQKSATAATVRSALGWHKASVKAFYTLNIERDEARSLNTDWFYREIIHGVFGEERWLRLDEKMKESVNRALLTFSPDVGRDETRLRAGAQAWWVLDAEDAECLIDAWKHRPAPNKRVNLSRRALCNLLPYMEIGLSLTEARQRFAEDPASSATPEQRARYAFIATDAVRQAIARQVGDEQAERLLRLRGINKNGRRFLAKHPDTLPPPPMLANPVVRQAIHEVRRHVNAYLRRFGRKPDRVVIELAREAYQTGRVRDEILSRNRRREGIRKKILQEFVRQDLSPNQQRAAVERVLLCQQQGEVCPYTGRHITPYEAGEGKDCESDHIVPLSRGGDSGLNNLVLVARGANRNKGNRTPREWLSAEDFGLVLQRMAHMEKHRDDEYFRKADYKRKWDNLNAVISEEAERRWRESQLSSTAYAARQVAEYLQGALYRDEAPGKQRIFFTNGRYTAMLRRDWQLYETGMLDPSEDASDVRARLTDKDRTDHRHHAIDAVVIALTSPKIVQEAASGYAWQEEQRSVTGSTPKRPPIAVPAPWKTVESLREAVVRQVFGHPDGTGGLLVCHRPVKRKVVGALHLENPLGELDKDSRLYTKRIAVTELTGKRLGLESDSPAKGGLGPVRDRGLRNTLREILKSKGIAPDVATKEDFKRLAPKGTLYMPSGVPIRTVKVIQRVEKPVRIEKAGCPARVYFPGSNHHMEIVEDEQTGNWTGTCITTFVAARRIRPPRGEPRQPLVTRQHSPGTRFVMSLAEGETIFSRRQDAPEKLPSFYVVAKLEKTRIHFQPHHDARPAGEQDRWSVAPSDLKNLGAAPGTPPYKVRVSPLGEVERLVHD